MRESAIERKACELLKVEGAIVIKITARHWPDRLVLWPGAYAHFIEFKRSGEKAREGQEACHTMLRGLGYRVDVIDNPVDLEKLIGVIKCQRNQQ